MTYNFDVIKFDKWYMKVSKYKMLLEFHRNSAKVIMINQFIQKSEPIYRLGESNTVSGEVETFPPPYNVYDLSDYR